LTKLRLMLQDACLKDSDPRYRPFPVHRRKKVKIARRNPYRRHRQISLDVLRLTRLLVILIMVTIPISLIATATSTYHTQTSSWGPDPEYCGAFGETMRSGFPFYWRTESQLLGITARTCTIQFLGDSVSYDWNAFLLDTVFYLALCYAVGFLYLISRSRLKPYSDSVSTRQID